MQQNFTDEVMLANTDSGNGLEPSGNKSLPGSMLTKFYDAVWLLWATMI